jgi:hypothetical protein
MKNKNILESYSKDQYSAIDAKFEAQKIAFGPSAFQAAKALRDLKILEIVQNAGSEGISQKEIVHQTKLSNYGVRVLLEAGLGMQLLLLNENKYNISKIGYFIQNDPMTIANMNFTHDVNYLGFFKFVESIKESKPIGLEVFGQEWDTVYQALSSLPKQVQDSWFAFDHFYSDGSFNEVLPLVFKNNPKYILDIGGNTGKWSLQCVKYNDDVKVTIVDLPQQCIMAQQNLSKYSESNRIKYYPCNVLSEKTIFPKNQDVIWMSQFLDCFSDEEIISIVKKVVSIMNYNTRLYIMETFWDNQKYNAAAYCLQQTSLYFTCIANGNSQMYRSDIFIDLLNKAGVQVEEMHHPIGISHTVLICKLN